MTTPAPQLHMLELRVRSAPGLEEVGHMTSATVGGGRVAGGVDAGWVATLVLGLATTALGVILIANPFASAWTLAVLVAIGLVANGLLELLRSRRTHRAVDVVAGILWIVGGIIAVAWPDITLWALAVVVGLSIVFGGAVKGTAALMDQGHWRGRGWMLASGAFSVVVGVIAVAWPKATVVVLAVLFGIEIAVFGLLEIAAALELRRAAHHAH
jgi:uncharacterized membrane protein HdeD (DUF308 family)